MALTSQQETDLLAFLASYNTNKKRISDLESAITAQSDHLLPVERAGATKNISVDDIKDFVLLNNLSKKSIQIFTTSGTWTKPAGCKAAHIKLVGGGGSGGNSTSGGTGAGGGGYSEKFITSGLGATETITVGLGGTAATNGNNGNTGGTTSFGAHCSASGGTGGKTANGLGVGSGGTGSGGDINIQGSSGTVSITTSQGGNGGGSMLSGLVSGGIGSNTGPGLLYGGGSGGANGGTGGAGAAGIVIVYEYY
jgi:hypothetical protein